MVMRIIYIIFFMGMLVGCKKERTEAYLIQHPLELKKILSDCKDSKVETQSQRAECDRAVSVANKLMVLIDDQQAGAEQFGDQLLKSQTESARLKSDVAKARAALNEAHDAAEISLAKDKLTQAEEAYKEQRKKVKIMLGVLSLNPPE